MTIKVIITGANSGIGKALALEYAKKGAVLGLIARDSDKLVSLQKILPCPSQIFSIDVTDIAQCRWAAEEFMAQHGIPDVVIANAGISQGTLTENFTDLKIFEEIIKTNLFGGQNIFYPFIQPFKKSISMLFLNLEKEVSSLNSKSAPIEILFRVVLLLLTISILLQ